MDIIPLSLVCAITAATILIAYHLGHNRGEYSTLRHAEADTARATKAAHDKGYQEGYADGYDQGTRQGYEDGRLYEAIAQQNTRIITDKKGKVYEDTRRARQQQQAH